MVSAGDNLQRYKLREKYFELQPRMSWYKYRNDEDDEECTDTDFIDIVASMIILLSGG